jgi:flagellar biosynthesis GTPase FlhF
MTEQETGVMPIEEPGTETEPTQQPAGGEGETLEQLQAELEDTRKALKSANRESAQRRKRLEELEALEKQREEAELSEMEKLQKQIAEQKSEIERVQKEALQVRVKSAVIAKASEMGFYDPEDAFNLVDRSKFEITDEGKVDGVSEALEALKESKPYMIKKARPAGVGQPTFPGENVIGTGETEAQQRARIFGGQHQNLFTPEGAKKHGGGVIEIEK